MVMILEMELELGRFVRLFIIIIILVLIILHNFVVVVVVVWKESLSFWSKSTLGELW